ncbi:MAG: MBL fold metallo-hydrolase [Bacteroidetes bacterium]|nr:MBL fold metallo-hydrolase [Bacteroidota bacterium]
MKNTILAICLIPLKLILSQPEQTETYGYELIGENLYKIEVENTSIIASIGPDGVLLSDVGRERSAIKLMSTIKEIGGDKVNIIINTHWHNDHTGGNKYFGKEAVLIAHNNVRNALSEEKHLKFWNEDHPAYPEYALPEITFTDRITLHFNGEDIEVIHLPNGHTNGDAMVYFSKSNILHVGDCIFSNGFPAIGFEMGGSVKGFAGNLNTIVSTMPPDVRIIVGHGPDYRIEDVKAYEKMIRSSLNLVHDAMNKGMSVKDIQQAGLLNRWEKYSNGFFSLNEWINMIYQSLVFQLERNSDNTKQFSEMRDSYLGQKPPGMTPEIFAPGIISTIAHEHSSPAFAPDGTEVFYSVFYPGVTTEVIMRRKFEKGKWSEPEVAPFSGCYRDGGPVFAHDGSKLYFYSTRPINEGEKPGQMDIWCVEKEKGEWGKPQHLGYNVNTNEKEMTLSVAKNGNIYFTVINSERGHSLYLAEFMNGNYLKAKTCGNFLGDNYNEWCPFISPDESYLILAAYKKDGEENNDLYVVFKMEDGSWSKAINLGETINTNHQEQFPQISYDGKYLFFTSNRFRTGPRNIDSYFYENQLTYSEIMKISRLPGNGRGDIYWVDTKIIDDLRKEALKDDK